MMNTTMRRRRSDVNRHPVGLLLLLLLMMTPGRAAADDIRHIWLTHASPTPDRLTVSWLTAAPGDSVVRFGPVGQPQRTVRVDENTTLHHVEIPLTERDVVYEYIVQTGDQRSAPARFKAYPTDVLRLAIAADWQSRPRLDALIADDVHLLLTAGDNIPNLHTACGPGVRDCVKPYVQLVETYPKLFRSTPFMPVLGNHDRQIHPRGKKPPAEPVYDVDAAAFRKFFALPGDEWKWRLDIPGFDLRLIGLDLNHISDFGTTWQTCHAFDEDSEQFRWYEQQMRDPPGHVVTLYNERNANVRRQAGGRWGELFRRGTFCVTGFGYFAERTVIDGQPYYNTSLNGRGNRYPDPKSKFLASVDSYILLTVRREGRMTVQIKSLAGDVLDEQTYAPR